MEKRNTSLLSPALLITLLVNLKTSVWASYLMLFVAGVFLLMVIANRYKNRIHKGDRKRSNLTQ